MLTRRQVLTGSVALAALGSLVALGHRPVEGPGARALSEAQLATLMACFELLLPEPGPARDLALGVDAFLVSDPQAAGELGMALGLFEHWGWTRFSRLTLDERRARLLAWEASPVGLRRQIFQALRRTAMFSWFSGPESWDAIGYDGPWVSP
jgi:hypothetical protein